MKTIDITPTWEGILPVMLEVLKNPKADPQAKKEVWSEFMRLARIADSLSQKFQS
jgi:hypothetical protein